MRKYLDDESGTVTLLFPGLLVVMFLMMVLVFNIMIWNSQRNDMQVMADCMSRAGATAISKTYAVRERTGHGLQDYHVYNELYSGKYRDIQGTAKRAADEDADIIYREFKKYNENHGWEVNELSIEYNPEGEKWLNAVWNPKLFAYETKPNLIGKEQYKNGNFSCVYDGKVSGIWMNAFGTGTGRDLELKFYSQSMAHGTVTGY